MSNFKTVGGTSRPLTHEALALVHSLQRTVNRHLSHTKQKLICVDGRLGDSTKNAVNKYVGRSFSSHEDLAQGIVQALSELKRKADVQNLAVVPDPEGFICKFFKQSSRAEPDGSVSHPPGIQTTSVGGLPLWLILLIGGGGSYYYLYKTQAGKKTRKSLNGGR